MAQYGYAGGFVPSTGYSQAGQYQPTAGIASNAGYGHGGAYDPASALPGNAGYSGLPGAAAPQHDTYSNSDSMTPDPSSGTLTNVSPAAYQGGGQPQNPQGYPGAMGNPAIGNSPSPANEANYPNFRWWIPSEGISRAVLQKKIQHFLGRDALSKPGPGRGENEGVPGFWISADQTFTSAMIRDMKEATLKDAGKRRRDDRDYPYDRESYDRDRDRDRDHYDRRDDPRDRRDGRHEGGRYDRDRDSKYDPRRDGRDPKYKPTGVTPPPQPGYDRRDRRHEDYPAPQQPYGQQGYPPQYPNQQHPYPPAQQPYGQTGQYGQYGNPAGAIAPPGQPGFPQPQGGPYTQAGYQDPRVTAAGYPGGYAPAGAQHLAGQYPASSPQAPPGYYYASDGNLYQTQY